MVTPSKGRTHGPGKMIVRPRNDVIKCGSGCCARRYFFGAREPLRQSENSGRFGGLAKRCNIVREAAHQACDLGEVAIGPGIEGGQHDACVRCSNRARDPAALRGDSGLADTTILFALAPFDKAQLHQFRHLSRDSGVVAAHLVGEIDETDCSIAFDLEEDAG
jgi:hypothetical protein